MTPILKGTASRLGLRKPRPNPCAVRCVLANPISLPPMTFDDYLYQTGQVLRAFFAAALRPPSRS